MSQWPSLVARPETIPLNGLPPWQYPCSPTSRQCPDSRLLRASADCTVGEPFMRCRYLVAFLLLHALPAGAQAPSDFTQVNIEDLMNTEVQRVFGASERLQPVTEAPSSVTIVTAAEIERYGYRTLADILR